MNLYDLNREAREIQDRIDKMNANIAWLEANRESQYSKPETNPVILPELDTPDLTPEQIKEQYSLLGESFLDETIAKLNQLQPSQLYENQTQKLPPPPVPQTHEEILKMVRKGDSIDSILLRFQGE